MERLCTIFTTTIATRDKSDALRAYSIIRDKDIRRGQWPAIDRHKGEPLDVIVPILPT